MNNETIRPRLSRREVIKWFVAASVAMSTSKLKLSGADEMADPALSKGYGTDPDLLKTYKPGDIWPLTLTQSQRETVTALADVILPADHLGPAASSLGVPEFIDEWVSAPYPDQIADRPVIVDGLAWVEAELRKRFDADFSKLIIEQQRSICDDIAYVPKAKVEFATAAEFFSRFRGLCAGGYFSTPEGWKAIGYVGQTPMASFDGPPPDVLKQVGVEQTVA